MPRMKILLMLSSLMGGGTERQVVNLAKALHAAGHSVDVAVPYANDTHQSELEEAGVSLIILNSGSRPEGRRSPKKLWNMVVRILRTYWLVIRSRYDILHGFGTTTNFYVSLVSVLSGAQVVWGIRDSRPGPVRGFRLIEKILAKRVALTIANSEAGRRSWINRGLPHDRIVVVPNGIDLDRFRIDSARGAEIRRNLGIQPGEKVVGMMGRTHPVKNHELLLRTARVLKESGQQVRFVVVGRSSPDRLQTLQRLSSELNIEDIVVWAGPTDVPERYFNSFDLTLSCSLTEGFSNVLVESMACGTPCVSTDVGDARLALGPFGEVVDPPTPQSLADAITRQLSVPLDRHDVRSLVTSRYSVQAMADRTVSYFVGLAASGSARG